MVFSWAIRWRCVAGSCVLVTAAVSGISSGKPRAAYSFELGSGAFRVETRQHRSKGTSNIIAVLTMLGRATYSHPEILLPFELSPWRPDVYMNVFSFSKPFKSSDSRAVDQM